MYFKNGRRLAIGPLRFKPHQKPWQLHLGSTNRSQECLHKFQELQEVQLINLTNDNYQGIKFKLSKEIGQKVLALQKVEKNYVFANQKVKEQVTQIASLKTSLKKFQVDGVDIDQKIAQFNQITGGLNLEVFRQGTEVALQAFFKTGSFTHLMPPRIIQDQDLSPLLIKNQEQSIQNLRAISFGELLIRWSHHIATKQIQKLLGNRSQCKQSSIDPSKNKNTLTIQTRPALRSVFEGQNQKEEDQVQENNGRLFTNQSNNFSKNDKNGEDFSQEFKQIKDNASDEDDDDENSFYSNEDDRELFQISRQIRIVPKDKISPEILSLVAMHFSPEIINQDDIITLTRKQDLRQKLELQIVLSNFILVQRICCTDDIIQNDYQPLYSLLAFLFYIKPSLEPEQKMRDETSIKESKKIIDVLMNECRCCLQPLIKSFKMPDLTRISRQLYDIQRIPINQIMCKWVNHILRQYSYIGASTEQTSRKSIMATSFQFNSSNTKQIKSIQDLNDLNLNNYEEIFKFIYYIGSNLNARCRIINQQVQIFELVDLPLITLLSPENSKFQQKQEDKSFYQKCRFITATISHITGRRVMFQQFFLLISNIQCIQDILLLRELLDKRKLIDWQTILLQVFLKRPIIIPSKYSELKNSVVQLDNLRMLYYQCEIDFVIFSNQMSKPTTKRDTFVSSHSFHLQNLKQLEYLLLINLLNQINFNQSVLFIEETVRTYNQLKIRLSSHLNFKQKQSGQIHSFKNRLTMPLTHNHPMITPHHVWRDRMIKHSNQDQQLQKEKFLELQRISSQNKQLLISVIQMFISYKHIWAFFKSLETQSFSFNKCQIQNKILTRVNPIETQMTSTELNISDQGQFLYRNLLNIEEFWHLLLHIAQEMHFKELSLEAKSDKFPDLFRYLIQEIVLKIDDTSFNQPFRKLQMKNDSRLIIEGSYHFLVPLFNAYANNKNHMAEDNFLKLLFDAQIFQDGYTKVQANKVLNQVLAKSPGYTGKETQRDDAVSVRDIAQFSQSNNGRQLIFYDFLECLFGLAQYGDRETSKKPLKKFVKFIDSTLLPKIKLYIDFFSESEKDKDNEKQRLEQLKSFKIPFKPMEELWNRYMGKNKFINH